MIALTNIAVDGIWICIMIVVIATGGIVMIKKGI